LTPVGRRLPSHATSGGRLLAAFDPKFAQARREVGFPRLTPCTVGNRQEFDRVLEAVRRQGYEKSFDEVTTGLSSVAAPVFDSGGTVRAALSIVDTSERVRPNSERLARLTLQASQVLTRRAGI